MCMGSWGGYFLPGADGGDGEALWQGLPPLNPGDFPAADGG